jgi:hypothetical protein
MGTAMRESLRAVALVLNPVKVVVLMRVRIITSSFNSRRAR